MKTSKKGAPRSGLRWHEVARIFIPFGKTSKTYRDRTYSAWLEKQIEKEEKDGLWLL